MSHTAILDRAVDDLRDASTLEDLQRIVRQSARRLRRATDDEVARLTVLAEAAGKALEQLLLDRA